MEDIQLWKLLFSAAASDDIAKLAENYPYDDMEYELKVLSSSDEQVILSLPAKDSLFFVERQNSLLALRIQYPGKLYDITIASGVKDFILFSDYSNSKILKVHVTLADGTHSSEIIHLSIASKESC